MAALPRLLSNIVPLSRSMTSAPDLFGRTGQSADYAAFRPRYPSRLLASFPSRPPHPTAVAVDVACGPGTVALALADFDWVTVYAVDRSASQLASAPRHPAVHYLQGDAPHALNLPDALRGHVSLMTVGQGLHWFDVPAFCAAVSPWLHPSGCLAVMGYDMSRIEADMDHVARDAYLAFQAAVEPYWSPQCHRGAFF